MSLGMVSWFLSALGKFLITSLGMVSWFLKVILKALLLLN